MGAVTGQEPRWGELRSRDGGPTSLPRPPAQLLRLPTHRSHPWKQNQSTSKAHLSQEALIQEKHGRFKNHLHLWVEGAMNSCDSKFNIQKGTRNESRSSTLPRAAQAPLQSGDRGHVSCPSGDTLCANRPLPGCSHLLSFQNVHTSCCAPGFLPLKMYLGYCSVSVGKQFLILILWLQITPLYGGTTIM